MKNIIWILILLALLGGVYYLGTQREKFSVNNAESRAALERILGRQVIEKEILAILNEKWQDIQAKFPVRPLDPGTTTWRKPYDVRFIGNDTLEVSFKDYEDNINYAFLLYENGQFQTLEVFPVPEYYSSAEHQKLVDKYGDKNFIPSGYSDPYTYIYRKNYGFEIELPREFIPAERDAEGVEGLVISMPQDIELLYATNPSTWEKYNIPSFTYIKDQKIGETTFKIYKHDPSGKSYGYWFNWGNGVYEEFNVGYEFSGTDKVKLEELLRTFRFVGWSH